jgi:FHS family L-fucose permease-like MFS transporter
MLLYAVGTVLLVPALRAGNFSVLLAGFFLIGTGFNFQLVAGNPLIMKLGPEATASSRLNLANALGAVAQIIAPALVAALIPVSGIALAGRVTYIETLFFGIAIVFGLTIGLTRMMRDPPGLERQPSQVKVALPAKVWWGLAAIVLGLGAEASLFGFFRNFLEDPAIGHLRPASSQLLFTVYLGLFATGRLMGSWVQRRIAPTKHLIIHLAASMGFLAALLFVRGATSVVLFVGLGFWISIFFPTLYAIAIDGLGERTARASGLLTMGFLGAAFFPVLQGRIADAAGLQLSFVCCLIAYALILMYAISMQRMAGAGTHPN